MGGEISTETSDHVILEVANSNVVEALDIANEMEIELQKTDNSCQDLCNRVDLAKNFIDEQNLIRKSIDDITKITFLKNNDNSYNAENNMELCKQIYVLLFEYFSKVENFFRIYNNALIQFPKNGHNYQEIEFHALNITKDFGVNSENINRMLVDSTKIENEIKEILSERVPSYKLEDDPNKICNISYKYIGNNLHADKKIWFQSFQETIVSKVKSIVEVFPDKCTGFNDKFFHMLTISVEYVVDQLKKPFKNIFQFVTKKAADAVQVIKKTGEELLQKAKKTAESIVDYTVKKDECATNSVIKKNVDYVVEKENNLSDSEETGLNYDDVALALVFCYVFPVPCLIVASYIAIGYGLYKAASASWNWLFG